MLLVLLAFATGIGVGMFGTGAYMATKVKLRERRQSLWRATNPGPYDQDSEGRSETFRRWEDEWPER